MLALRFLMVALHIQLAVAQFVAGDLLQANVTVWRFVQHLPRRKISRKIPVPEAAQHIHSDRVCGCTAFAPEKHGSALKSLMCDREGYDDLL